MDERIFEFEGELVGVSEGGPTYCVIYLPAEIAEQLTFSKSSRLRVNVEIDGFQFEAAWMPTRGKWYLTLSKKRRREMGIEIGDRAIVKFHVADQDAVAVPVALTYALQADPLLQEAWDELTPGKQRSWCYRISSAKLEATRARRIEECLEWLSGL